MDISDESNQCSSFSLVLHFRVPGPEMIGNLQVLQVITVGFICSEIFLFHSSWISTRIRRAWQSFWTCIRWRMKPTAALQKPQLNSISIYYSHSETCENLPCYEDSRSRYFLKNLNSNLPVSQFSVWLAIHFNYQRSFYKCKYLIHCPQRFQFGSFVIHRA